MKSVIFCLLLTSLSAHAVTEREYQVDLLARNVNKWAEAVTFLAGYSCSSSSSLTFSEVLLNYAGKPKRQAQTKDWSYNWSTFLQPESRMTMSIVQNGYAQSPQLTVNLNETCTKSYSCDKTTEECDDNGRNCRSVTRSETCTDTKFLQWSCDFTSFPEQVGSSQQLRCQPQGWATWLHPLAHHARQKEVLARVKLHQVNEKLTYDLCPGQTETYTLVFEQGLSGYWAENDFVLIVGIDGHEYPIKSKSGSFAHDIRVCGNRRGLDLKLRAIEEDYFWDDNYTPVHQLTNVTLVHGFETEETLKRRALWSGVFIARDSRIRIRVINGNRSNSATVTETSGRF